MTSAIDPTVPASTNPTTASVRANFQTAANEISALQSTTSSLQSSKADLSALASSSGSSLVGFQQLGTGSGTTDLQTRGRKVVYVTDYYANGVSGALVGTGADDTAGINAAALFVSSTGGEVIFPSGNYIVSGTINAYSNVTYKGIGSATVINCANGDINIFYGSGISEGTIKDMKIVVSIAGSTAYIGAVNFEASNNCYALNLELVGMSWSGVLLSNSNYCTVRGIYGHGWLGTVQDSADIHVFRASSFNVVRDNFCYGGGYHGIMIQDPGTNLIPTRNIISGNRVGAHGAYGIVQYNIDAADSFTEISNNFVENITGAVTTGTPPGAFGAGIYVNHSGGVAVTGNTVRNCCINTTNTTLAPAGIGINNIVSTLSPCVVAGNIILDIVNYFGIYVVSSQGGVTISGNSVRLNSNVSAATNGIYIHSASNCTVSGNTIFCANTTTTTGIFAFADGVTQTNIVVSNNNIIGCGYASIRTDQNGGFLNTQFSISGNTASGGGVSCINYRLSSLDVSTITANNAIANSTQAISINACTRTGFANNSFTTSGALSVGTSGTCTGSYFDKTNYSGINYSFIQNSATGLIVEFLGNAAPLTSNWSVGDRVEQSVPVVGNPKGWRCTVAGVPGTWVSEGNL